MLISWALSCCRCIRGETLQIWHVNLQTIWWFSGFRLPQKSPSLDWSHESLEIGVAFEDTYVVSLFGLLNWRDVPKMTSLFSKLEIGDISLDIFPAMNTVFAWLCFGNYHIVHAPCPSVEGLCWLRGRCSTDSQSISNENLCSHCKDTVYFTDFWIWNLST